MSAARIKGCFLLKSQ